METVEVDGLEIVLARMALAEAQREPPVPPRKNAAPFGAALQAGGRSVKKGRVVKVVEARIRSR